MTYLLDKKNVLSELWKPTTDPKSWMRGLEDLEKTALRGDSASMPKTPLKPEKPKRRPPNLREEVKRAMSKKAGAALVDRTLRAIEAE